MKPSVFLTVGCGIAASIVMFLWVTRSPNLIVSIYLEQTPELGDEIIVRYPSWISQARALQLFSITPKTEGQLVWKEDTHELLFLPNLEFEPSLTYTVTITDTLPLFAAVSPTNKHYTFTTKTSALSPVSLKASAPETTPGKYIDINLKTMILTLYEDDKVIKTFHVAGKGRPDRGPTPEGYFKVLKKEPNHFSKHLLWMPWSLNFSNAGYYIHGWPYFQNGEKVKVAYSLGCVRLYDGQDKEIYDWADVGTPIRIHSSTEAVLVAPEAVIHDGDLIRELSDQNVYLIKVVGDKKFKRHVLSEAIAEWYPHLSPFHSKVKIVPDGSLTDYFTSRWIHQEHTNAIYELDANSIKHLMTCNSGSEDCFGAWSSYGWDSNEIYTVNENELNYYTNGNAVQLQQAPLFHQ